MKIKFRKSNKNQGCIKTFLKLIDTYFKLSSLHGFRYLSSEEKIPTSHRILWIFKIVLTLIFCGWMLVTFSKYYRNAYTITAIETNTYPVGRISFPCVTICNINKVSKRDFQKISDLLSNNGIETSDINDFARSLELSSSLSTFNYNDREFNNHTNIINILKNHGYTLERIMEEVHQKCSELLDLCIFKSNNIDCMKKFKTIKSMEGYCCSFNHHGPGQSEKIYASGKMEKVSGYGLSNGLTVILNIKPDDYASPSKPYYGAVVLITDPIDYPEISLKSGFVQLNGSLQLLVSPSIIISSPQVKRLPIKERDCKFPEEITENMYSYQSCVTECKMKIIYDTCKCIPYFYPQNENYRKKCDFNDLICLMKNNARFNNISQSDRTATSGISCNCMPECTATFYSVRTIQRPLKKSYFVNRNRNLSYVDKSIISVAYPNSVCVKYIRDAYFYWNDVFAICGGVFSLCIGGSIISVMEMIFELFYKIRQNEKRPDKRIQLPFIN